MFDFSTFSSFETLAPLASRETITERVIGMYPEAALKLVEELGLEHVWRDHLMLIAGDRMAPRDRIVMEVDNTTFRVKAAKLG